MISVFLFSPPLKRGKRGKHTEIKVSRNLQGYLLCIFRTLVDSDDPVPMKPGKRLIKNLPAAADLGVQTGLNH